jgi:diguanylate cyclase (GGDEF)-like protein/PAS domain S-box-containing protein
MRNRPAEYVRSSASHLDYFERQPKAFFKEVIEASSTGIVITEPSGTDNPIVYANPAFEAMTGYDLDDVVGRDCRFLQRDDRRQPEIELIRRCVRAGEICNTMLRNYRKDGSLFWCRMHLFPVREPEGQPVRFVAFLEDMTEIVEAQRATQHAREHLGTVLESISDGCFSLDRDWRFTYVNPRGAAWLAREADELLGRYIWDAFPEGAHGPFHQTYERAMEEQVFASCEAFYAPLNLWIEARAYPSRDGLTVFFADVTARKEAEARLVHLATHDTLTGLHNRFSCLRVLDAAMARALDSRRPVGVLFIDLDHFKEVNDAHGHRCGDQALQEIGRRLADFAAPSTTVARISGDEFVFVLEDANGDSARVLAASVLQRLAAPIPVDGHQVSIGASIGIAIGSGDELTPDELLNNADAAMYEAKDNGRHTVAVFSPGASSCSSSACSCARKSFRRSTGASSSCTTSRRSAPPTAPWSGPRPCCAGTIRAWACWRRRPSWRCSRIRPPSTRSAPGSTRKPAARRANGSCWATACGWR